MRVWFVVLLFKGWSGRVGGPGVGVGVGVGFLLLLTNEKMIRRRGGGDTGEWGGRLLLLKCRIAIKK